MAEAAINREQNAQWTSPRRVRMAFVPGVSPVDKAQALVGAKMTVLSDIAGATRIGTFTQRPRVPFGKERADMQREPVPVYEQPLADRHLKAKERLSSTSSTREYIDFFKTYYREEGLPVDWQKLQYGDTQVGFSIKRQMELLKDDSPESRKKWALQTFRDLQGFLIEYISPYDVFPWQHEVRVTSDGSAHLVDTRYGDRRMIDLVTGDERDGAVKSVSEQIDRIVVTGKKPDGSVLPDGSIFLEVSPQDSSPTGLLQDNGTEITYKDTHIKISQIVGDKLVGFTLQTDFTKAECRELLYRVSGKRLPKDAPIAEYIRAFAIIDPNTGSLKNLEDLVGVAAKVRSDMSFGSKYAFKDKTWKNVLDQIGQGNKLYDWTETSQALLKKFVQDVIHDHPERKELPDYMGATLLRAVQAAQIDQLANVAVQTTTQQLHYILPPSDFGNFGNVLKATAAIPGCAGGGGINVIDITGKNRSAQVGGTIAESCPRISCACGWVASDAEVAAVQAETLTLCPRCDSPPSEGSVEKRMQKEAALAAAENKKEEVPVPKNTGEKMAEQRNKAQWN